MLFFLSLFLFDDSIETIVSTHGRTDTHTNSQRLIAHTRPASVQTRENPSVEQRKKTQCSTPTYNLYILGKGKLVFYAEVSLHISNTFLMLPKENAHV